MEVAIKINILFCINNFEHKRKFKNNSLKNTQIILKASILVIFNNLIKLTLLRECLKIHSNWLCQTPVIILIITQKLWLNRDNC